MSLEGWYTSREFSSQSESRAFALTIVALTRDKTLAALLKNTKQQLVEYIQGSMPIVEDSQDAAKSERTSIAGALRVSRVAITVLICFLVDRISNASLKALIESLATRTNYGLEVSDLPDGLPAGVTDIPNASPSCLISCKRQLTRYLAHAVPPNLVLGDPQCRSAPRRARSETRKAQGRPRRGRLLPSRRPPFFPSLRPPSSSQIKSTALKLFLALPASEQTELLLGKKKAKAATTASSSAATKDDAPVASGSTAPKKKVKTEVNEAEAEENAKAKAEKDVEKESKRLAKEKLVRLGEC